MYVVLFVFLCPCLVLYIMDVHGLISGSLAGNSSDDLRYDNGANLYFSLKVNKNAVTAND